MGIFQAPSILTGQVGVIGALKYMVSTDSLATITAAGYLNAIDLAVNPISASNVLGITYSYNLQSNSGTFGIFTVSITNGVITLVQWANPGDVLLPVVSGDVAMFNGTTGQISDSSILATNLVVKNAINTMAAGSEIILDKGTATTTAGAATVNKQSGVLTTPSLTTAAAAAYSITLTNSEVATSSVVLLSLMGGTNTTQGLQLSGVPTAGSLAISLYNNNVAGSALNGTVIIGFTIF